VDDFTLGDERILSLFGNQAAIALENARLHREAVEKERMEREIELAASIQKTILPVSLPVVAGLTLAGANRPTRQVGGDYFDVFPLPDGRTAFCVADVAGKGVPAALLVSTVHACLRILLDAGVTDLPVFVARVHRHLLGFSSTRRFVTLFFVVFDPVRHEIRYLNAGHNPGLLISRGETTLLPSGGPPIGILPDAIYREAVVPLSPGDTLILYSDGITEAVNAADEEFGMDRLIALVQGGCDEPPEALSGRIFGTVSEFTRGVAQYDDQTVLIARAC
jgi:sigma-B regulation protein RsbU (phosphoserine phosphatase)